MKMKLYSKIIIYTIILMFSVLYIFPFYWLIRSSFMTSAEIFAMPMRWLPKQFLWTNFSYSLTAFPFIVYLRNTLFIVILNIVGNIFASSFAAFGFARLDFPGKKFFFGLIISTMMIPWAVLLIPSFIIWQRLGFYDTYVPLTLPAFFMNAYYIFLVRQFINTLPKDYDEAARIDGAGYLSIYAKIILPLIIPALATVGVFSFMWSWNDFLGPLIYLRSSHNLTLALGLRQFLAQYTNQWHYLMAASSVVILPMILLYFFAQRYFIEGISFSGLKG